MRVASGWRSDLGGARGATGSARVRRRTRYELVSDGGGGRSQSVAVVHDLFGFDRSFGAQRAGHGERGRRRSQHGGRQGSCVTPRPRATN